MLPLGQLCIEIAISVCLSVCGPFRIFLIPQWCGMMTSGQNCFTQIEKLRNLRQKFVLPVFNRNFSKLFEFFLTYFGNLLDFFLTNVWWSLDYFWKKKCRLNKRAKKTLKKNSSSPTTIQMNYLKYDYIMYLITNRFFFFFLFIKYTRKHTLLNQYK